MIRMLQVATATHALPAIVAGFGGFCAAGCDKGPSSSGPAVVAKPVVGFEKGKVSLTGKVTFKGKPPRPDSVLDTSGDTYCKTHGAISSKRWEITPDGGFSNVVIAVVNAPMTVFGDDAAIDQKNCQYLPSLLAVPRGQAVTVTNSDSTFHNVRVVRHKAGTQYKGQNLMNYSQPNKGAKHAHEFNGSGLYRLECDVHRWMKSWVFVHDNCHVTLSRQGGAFTLDRGLRDGTYTVRAWHPEFPNPIQKSVEVVDGRAEVNFEFNASEAFK